MAKFEKGKSGNPGGRPKAQGEIREIARQHTSAAIETLVTVMCDKAAQPSARVGAASALLDRGWGRPHQSIEASITNPGSVLSSSALGSISDLLDKVSERSEQAGSRAIVSPAPALKQ